MRWGGLAQGCTQAATLDPLHQKRGVHPRRADTPLCSPPSAAIPCPSAPRPLRWHSGHIWKPHLGQLQCELKKPHWQESQSWGAPAPRLQALTPMGNTALSPPGPGVTPDPGPRLPSGAPAHTPLSLRTASQKGSPSTRSRYLARQRLLPVLRIPCSGLAASSSSASASPRVQKPSGLSSPPAPRANLRERGQEGRA